MSLGDALFDYWTAAGVDAETANAMLKAADDNAIRALEREIYKEKYLSSIRFTDQSPYYGGAKTVISKSVEPDPPQQNTVPYPEARNAERP